MQSVMSHQFSQVPRAEIQRSSFDRSHGYKTTFDAGYLVPFFIDEILPGDTFNLRVSAFARLATPIKPIMDNIYLDTFFFFVPNRLLWDNWQKFNGEQRNPGDSTSFVMPQMTGPAGAGIVVGSLSDYFGLPTGIASITFNSLWHRAYNLIYNEWFRDQNLQNSVTVDVDDGPDTYTDYVLKKRNKRHDFFTSSLPWPQKGTAVSLPLGSSAPIVASAGLNQAAAEASVVAFGAAGASRTITTATNPLLSNVAGPETIGWKVLAGQSLIDAPQIASKLTADLTNATAATINSLRQAFQLQKLYERDARGGTRYVEILKAHFGISNAGGDARFQRPEFLGGGRSYVNIHPVAQTTEAIASTPQGNLAAFGTASFNGHGFSKSFTEHGVVIGLVCATADLTYQQGMDRMFSRRTRFDHYWPALAHLGEQSVLNQEIYMQGTGADDDVFGYQERYGEYRYKPSKITGIFRSTYATPLDMWHLSQEFGSLPTLGSTFITEDPPIDRVIAVPSEPHFLFDSYISLKCARPMPVYGVPGLIDHF